RLDVARDLFRTSQAGFFFFQAEDGIRDFHVTGVQTCALPICLYDCGIAAAAKRCGLTQALGGTLTRTATHEPRTANTIASWLLSLRGSSPHSSVPTKRGHELQLLALSPVRGHLRLLRARHSVYSRASREHGG